MGHNLTIGGRELEYSGTHLKGIVTDVQVSSKLSISLVTWLDRNCSGFFKSYQHGGGCCLHHLFRGRLRKVDLFAKNLEVFQDVRGDIASWEKEEGWETVGDVNIVTLRLLVHCHIKSSC